MRPERLAGSSILIGAAPPGIRPSFEQAAAEADALRNPVYDALSSLSIEQRSLFRNRLWSDLSNAGFNVPACLLMLGVSALTADELTAPELASLVRYIRLSDARAMMALDETLRDLLPVE